jgi:hypothetical protein
LNEPVLSERVRWQTYFNDYLLSIGVLTADEHQRMRVKILTQKQR